MTSSQSTSSAYDVLRTDPVMADLVDRHGFLDASPADDEFQRLCTSIINQQLSTASAAAIGERVLTHFDGTVTPEAVLAADETPLREAGLSEQKITYMRNAAEAFLECDLTREALADHTDEEVIDELTTIHGIGAWTARMYLIFALGRDDVLPLGDLGVRKGIQQLYANGESMTRDEMREVAERWRPYRSYGTRYVWLAYESD